MGCRLAFVSTSCHAPLLYIHDPLCVGGGCEEGVQCRLAAGLCYMGLQLLPSHIALSPSLSLLHRLPACCVPSGA